MVIRSRGVADGHAFGSPITGVEVGIGHIAEVPARLHKQCVDADSGFLLWRHGSLLWIILNYKQKQPVARKKHAQAEKAVLLRDRRGAQRTYEVTEVNEMLQGMERYAGIFICTTNLLESLDQAALRRCTFKIKFMPLTSGQRETMFVTEALAGDASLLTVAAQKRLAQLTLDMALSAEEFLEQLEAEHSIKPEVREGRAMGFMH
jgi:SpoVK/Ycf46/Vps4 family AAA+-type ATPase